MISPSKLKEVYKSGKNINEYLKNKLNIEHNSVEIIEISYDLQASTYTKNVINDPEKEKYYKNYTLELSKIIKELSNNSSTSIMEAGIGEATTLGNLLNNLDDRIDSYGFDISYSRLIYAKKYLESLNHNGCKLSTGNLYDIPFVNNAIDIVYTSHTIEPNGGSELKILQELYRVANKYLILLEPGYEFSNDKAKERMDRLGYCKNLKEHAISLGYKVIEHKLFKYCANELNPTAITIIEKNVNAVAVEDKYACPIYKSPLKLYSNQALYSDESLMMYPIIDEIPCLRKTNGIIATKLMD